MKLESIVVLLSTYALICARVLVILVSSLFDIDLSRFAVPIIVPSVINKELVVTIPRRNISNK